MRKISNENLIAFHPGYYIKKYLDDQNMNQRELADRLNTNEKTVSQLINGKIDLDNRLITGLALVLGTSESVWKNLNDKYLATKNQIEEQNQLEEEKTVQRQLDYKYWTNLGVVQPTNNADKKVFELRKFFHISNLKVLENKDFLVQYKMAVSEITDKNVINSNAWVQTALNMGELEDAAPINLESLKKSLPEIRKMALDAPTVFLPKLKQILGESGVAFVVIPNLRSCGINGAVKWLGKDKVLLAMNDCSKYTDIFWFTFFHEIRHVFQQKKGHIILSTEKNIGLNSALDLEALEKDADEFAKSYLIGKIQYNEFVAKGDFSKRAIEEFSKENQISSGIAVGQLQRDKYIPVNRLNNLRQKYSFAADKSR